MIGQSNCDRLSSRMSNKKTEKQLKKLLALSDQPRGQSLPMVSVEAEVDFKLDWTDLKVSREEIFSEYLDFLRSMNNIISSEKEKILKVVRTKLKIPEIEENLASLKFENLLHIKDGNRIIDRLSIKLGWSLR